MHHPLRTRVVAPAPPSRRRRRELLRRRRPKRTAAAAAVLVGVVGVVVVVGCSPCSTPASSSDLGPRIAEAAPLERRVRLIDETSSAKKDDGDDGCGGPEQQGRASRWGGGV